MIDAASVYFVLRWKTLAGQRGVGFSELRIMVRLAPPGHENDPETDTRQRTTSLLSAEIAADSGATGKAMEKSVIHPREQIFMLLTLSVNFHELY